MGGPGWCRCRCVGPTRPQPGPAHPQHPHCLLLGPGTASCCAPFCLPQIPKNSRHADATLCLGAMTYVFSSRFGNTARGADRDVCRDRHQSPCRLSVAPYPPWDPAPPTEVAPVTLPTPQLRSCTSLHTAALGLVGPVMATLAEGQHGGWRVWAQPAWARAGS